ncbi:MAG: hypothetical protein RBR86_05825 [Pseudobdellovibrionaceae bacterium]|jgi:hypothetical protein|nr:hypothetical protein [Pseudobdellovibrionaceae bacterium]
MSEHPKYDRALKVYGQKLFDHYKSKFPDNKLGNDVVTLFGHIAKFDPSHDARDPKKQFQNIDWLSRQLLNYDVRPQDIYKIRDDLTLFARKGKAAGNANLDSYTLPSLADAMFPFLSELSEPSSAEKRRQERHAAEKNSKIFYDGPEGKILMPLTMEAAQFWGRGTRWCISATSSDNLFKKYNRGGAKPIVMFLPSGAQEKYAFNLIDGAMRDAKDAETDKVSISLFHLTHCALTNAEAKQIFDGAGAPLRETLQQGVLAVPEFYSKLLATGSAQHFPAVLTPEAVVKDFVLKSQDMDWWAVSMGRLRAPGLFSTPLTLVELSKYSESETDSIRHELGDVDVLDQIFENVRPEFDLDQTALKTPDGILSAIEACLPRMKGLYDLLDRSGYRGFDLDELLISHFMQQVPDAFWQDVQFALDFIQAMPHIRTGLVEDGAPAMFQHPEVVLYFVDDLRETGSDMIPDFLKSVPDIRNMAINGQQLFDAALPRTFETVSIAKEFSDAAQETGIIDHTQLARKIITDFKDGVDHREELEMLLYDMDALDVTPVVEATIEKHPDWFEDVPSLKQTQRMAEIAVMHNPEALLDVRSDFLRAHDGRSAAFDDAYGKLGQGAAKTSLAPFFGSQHA